jgi:hypothetical protein
VCRLSEASATADVAPATVRNHFPDPRGLGSRAVFEAMLAEVDFPTPAIFDGLDGLRARVGRLARELAAFYERSQPEAPGPQRRGGCRLDAGARSPLAQPRRDELVTLQDSR